LDAGHFLNDRTLIMSAAAPETVTGVAGGEDAGLDLRNAAALLDGLLVLARHYRLSCSPQSLHAALPWLEEMSQASLVGHLAGEIGLQARVIDLDVSALTAWRLPILLQLQDGQVAVLEAVEGDGSLRLQFAGDRGLAVSLYPDELQSKVVMAVVARPVPGQADSRIDEYIQPWRQGWFREAVFPRLSPYTHVLVASLIANTLALAGVLFSMQVYDRVIPAQSYPTLYVLFSGVVLALVFDFLMRLMRLRLIDVLGKQADIRLSDRVFGHALRIRNDQRPRSTGAFIAQLRDLEQIRELVTSSTVAVLADLPFFLLFLAVFWYIAGGLVLIPLLALLALIIPGLLLQRRMAKLATAAMRESALRNGVLIESVQGLDDIKSLQAEQRFQSQWNHYNSVTAESSLRLRYISNGLNAWAHNVQTSVFAVVVLFGAPLVMAGDMTTGALVAASILVSRMLAPMGQLSQVMGRWQQARVARRGIDTIMKLAGDHPTADERVHKSVLRGDYRLQAALFRHDDQNPRPALFVARLQITPGEKVAVLGRNGSGKSTLLQALAGLLPAAEGEILIDGVQLSHIDPADLRRDVMLLGQQARLFHGTLRDNLLLADPHANDEQLQLALAQVGAGDFLNSLQSGLDHTVLEGGHGLSGGQRQSVMLARLLLKQPRVVLLDEPTASLDEAAERQLVDALQQWSAMRTLVIATHRMSVLRLVDRIIVLDRGRVVMDDRKDKALQRLQAAPRPRSQEASP